MCLSQKAQQRLKLPVAPSLQRLQVYRWAHQALATPPDHPILPLVWQKFLQLYLRQPGPDYGYDGCMATVIWDKQQSSILKVSDPSLVLFHPPGWLPVAVLAKGSSSPPRRPLCSGA